MSILVLGLTSVAGAVSTEPSSWNSSYAYREPITVFADDGLVNGYQVSVRINHAQMVSAGRSLANGNDVRIARFNGSTWTELDRVLKVGSSWNSSSTTLFFRTQTTISARTHDHSYYLYHGNPSAGSPPANANNVYDLFEDFSGGSLASKGWQVSSWPGTSVVQTGGELVVSGTTQSGTHNEQHGVSRNIGTTYTNFTVEQRFAIVQQSASARTWSRARLGHLETDGLMWAATGSLPKSIKSYKDGDQTYGTSTLNSQTFGYQDIALTATSKGVEYFENGELRAHQTNSIYNRPDIWFHYTPAVANQTFDVRFDDIVVRKATANPPVATLGLGQETTVGVDVEPTLTFTVAPHSGNCNNVSLNGTSTGTAVDLGRINSVNGTGAQMLSVATNATSGFSVSIRGSGPLTSAGSTIANVSATNSAPAAFPTGEAFGYTTSDSSLGTGAPDRFTTGGGNRWAALTTSNAEVMAHPSPTNNEAACVGFQAGVGPTTPAGVYQTAVTYTALARY